MLRTVREVAEHNRTSPPEQRFHGVRYDIEPYLLPTFQGPARGAILDNYVALIAAIADEAHAGGLAAGADIPSWLDAPDEVTGEAFEELAVRTRGASALRHWFAGRPVRVAGDMLSFHSLGADAMDRVTAAVLGELSGREAFLGFAFHDYRGLRRLLESR